MGERITVLTAGSGPVDVDCFPTPVPGLVINRSPVQDGWSVTHRRSGAGVLIGLPSSEHALHMAIALEGIADWTLSALDLRGDPAIVDRFMQAVDDAGAQSYNGGPAMPSDAIAAAEAGAS